MSNKVGTHLHIVEKSASQAGAGNGETLYTNNAGKGIGVIYYDPAGGSRTGVILQAGRENGQQVKVVNVADAAETITFAAEGTSNVANGDSVVISRYEAVQFVYHKATGLWYATPLPAVGAASIETADIADGAVTGDKVDAGVIKTVEVELTATEIVGTSAGDLGHAAGAVLVAAEADVIHEFISAVLIYDFDTAAYTGGGNDLTIRQGTTAVSDAVSSANLLGAAGDKIASVACLSAAENVLTANSTLNIASTAWTQPGTAAGVLRVRITYRSHPAGLA